MSPAQQHYLVQEMTGWYRDYLSDNPKVTGSNPAPATNRRVKTQVNGLGLARCRTRWHVHAQAHDVTRFSSVARSACSHANAGCRSRRPRNTSRPSFSLRGAVVDGPDAGRARVRRDRSSAEQVDQPGAGREDRDGRRAESHEGGPRALVGSARSRATCAVDRLEREGRAAEHHVGPERSAFQPRVPGAKPRWQAPLEDATADVSRSEDPDSCWR